MSVPPISPSTLYQISDGPIPNVAPFSYGDGQTFLMLVQTIRQQVSNLTDSQNNVIAATNQATSYVTSIQSEINTMNSNYGSLKPLDANTYYTAQIA